MSLPSNVHVSQHPCLRAKLSQLRSKSTAAKDVKTLVHEIGLIVATEALAASTKATDGPKTILPGPVPVHHLGLYREPSTLEPVEYYNNLPNHISADGSNPDVSSLAIILDPVIATGGTCAAAIQTLREWGVQRIIVMSVIGAAEGVKRAAGEWADATEIWIAGVDEELTPNGMLKPGVGDVGDRLFLTIGK
ncbi:hypothetical protein Brms1b_011938 [Colletotrichum noveboracense]|nr:hypothetical protein CBS470a_011207 [Colletotrichum nupharicola]KAJ0285209.1 hypothetical protein COL940_003626 [Colletotrichum noveboracense]KAJ0302721.1 hypothetical protein Brms1b_011938 [Colletotrichum noveboracense]